MKKKCWIVLCVVFMLSVAAGCGSKSMETMSDFASGESSMNAAIENEDYKNEGEIAAEEGITSENGLDGQVAACLLYTSPSPRDGLLSRMPSSA